MTQASGEAGKIEAVDTKTVKISLPRGVAVTPGQPVPIELLEYLAGYFALVARGGTEGCGTQIGCSPQFG